MAIGNITVTQDVPFKEVESAFQTFDYVARRAYGIDFREILSEHNSRRRSARVRQISGVILKLNYSKESVKSGSGLDQYKWRIDEDRLARKSDDDWESRMLAAYPGRRPTESAKQQVAMRLKHETNLGRAFVQSLHEYVCKDAKTRARVKKILKPG
jgi:hypothetical protein